MLQQFTIFIKSITDVAWSFLECSTCKIKGLENMEIQKKFSELPVNWILITLSNFPSEFTL